MKYISESIDWLKDALSYQIINLEKFQLTVFNIVVLIGIFIITRYLLRILQLILNKRLLNNSNFDKGSVNSFMQLIKYFAYVIAIAIALESMGIKMSFILASSAALLIGVGLGLQQVFYDIVSGIILLFEGTIQVEDVVQIQDLVGRVKFIGLRTSKIYTREGTYIIVPNSKFISGDVINWSHLTTSTRFDVTVGVAFGSDVNLVRECLLKSVEEHKLITDSPTPFVRFNDFGENSLVFKLYFWTDETFAVENIKSDLRFSIDKLFRENNIRIPFPQRDIHFNNVLDVKKTSL